MLDIDLEDSLMKKIEKNNKRIYIKNEKGVLVKEGE